MEHLPKLKYTGLLESLRKFQVIEIIREVERCWGGGSVGKGLAAQPDDLTSSQDPQGRKRTPLKVGL